MTDAGLAHVTDGIRHVLDCMGTVFSFDIRCRDAAETVAARETLVGVVARLRWVDSTFSTYRADSPISRLGRGEITIAACPPEVAEVLDLCAEVTRVSHGYFSAMPQGRLDPSGLVKGWAIERASATLLKAGCAVHAVNGGGDIQLAGGPAPGRPWRIGIAHPLRAGALATIVSGCDIAVATSGTAERGAHVVDPFTGRPATEFASITLVGRHLTMVDAYATAAMAMGPAARDWIETLPGIEALAVTSGGDSWGSSGWHASDGA